MLSELLFGIGNVDKETRLRNGNSSVVELVRPINSVTMERRMGGFLESNREGSGINQRLAISRIMGGLHISDEMAQTKARGKLVMLSARNISQTTGGGNKDVISKSPHLASNINRIRELLKVQGIWTHSCALDMGGIAKLGK